MKELRKRFETKQDNLRSFITCSCPYIQCACDNLDDYSIDNVTAAAHSASTEEQSSYYNR